MIHGKRATYSAHSFMTNFYQIKSDIIPRLVENEFDNMFNNHFCHDVRPCSAAYWLLQDCSKTADLRLWDRFLRQKKYENTIHYTAFLSPFIKMYDNTHK